MSQSQSVPSSQNILNSNSFQQFLDSLTSSTSNKDLSLFLSNQLKENEIVAGKKRKSKKIKGKRVMKNNEVMYVPSITNGNKDIGIIIAGSGDSSCAYKNHLLAQLTKEFEVEYNRIINENGIPIINSGKILDNIEIVETIDESQIDNIQNIDSGAKSSQKKKMTKKSMHM